MHAHCASRMHDHSLVPRPFLKRIDLRMRGGRGGMRICSRKGLGNQTRCCTDCVRTQSAYDT